MPVNVSDTDPVAPSDLASLSQEPTSQTASVDEGLTDIYPESAVDPASDPLLEALNDLLTAWLRINSVPSGQDVSALVQSLGVRDPNTSAILEGYVRDIAAESVAGPGGSIDVAITEAPVDEVLDVPDDFPPDPSMATPADDGTPPSPFAELDALSLDLDPELMDLDSELEPVTSTDFDFVPDESLVTAGVRLMAEADHRPPVEVPASDKPIALGDNPLDIGLNTDGEIEDGTPDPQDVAMQHDGEPVSDADAQRDGIPGTRVPE